MPWCLLFFVLALLLVLREETKQNDGLMMLGLFPLDTVCSCFCVLVRQSHSLKIRIGLRKLSLFRKHLDDKAAFCVKLPEKAGSKENARVLHVSNFQSSDSNRDLTQIADPLGILQYPISGVAK